MSSRRALIVEDNPDDQEKLKGLLDARKYDYDVVDSPLKARLKLKEREYLFVILDLDLGAGVDEGKFLLDTMFNEDLRRPTIIMSYAGLLPETVALKSRYKFIYTFIDKKHLYTLLNVFDDALNDIATNEEKRIEEKRIEEKQEEKHDERRQPVGPQVFTLWGTMLALLLAFVVIVGVVVGAARLVPPLLLGMVLISVILIFLLVGALVLKLVGGLTEQGLLEIAGKIVGALPLLRNYQSGGKREDKPLGGGESPPS